MKTTPIRSASVQAAIGMFFVLGASSAAAQQELWPVRFEANGVYYQVFAPQPESITGERFTARMAVGVQRTNDDQPVFGAVWGDGVLALDDGARIGTLTSFTVTDARFPSLSDEAELLEIRESISNELPGASGPLNIDQLAAELKDEQQAGSGFSNEAPEIIYTETPSALVFIDGAPRYEELNETLSSTEDGAYANTSGATIERVTNTPYMILRTSEGDHFLYGSGIWFRTRDMSGVWRKVDNVPRELRAIGETAESTAEITASDDQRKVPEIVVRTTPAELLDLDGPPQFEPVQNTSLLYATNTNRNFFLDIGTQQYYLLASGRWFATRDPKHGTWTHVPSDKLPTAFASIPEGSKKDAVLAHITGTDAALDASREASVPQTARIDRNTASVSVTYEGAPEFERISGTNVEFARNASTNVLRINGRYHVCDNAVWFEGQTPDGPWTVSTVVPEEVSNIPPSSPVYNVRYVYIYDSTPQYVYGGYTPGYLGSYGYGGSLFYGTGYYYGGWGRWWRPWPSTWGFGMCYSPWYGWGFNHNWGWGGCYSYFGGGWSGHHGCGWWGSACHYPHYHDPHHGGYYGHHGHGGRTIQTMRPSSVYAGREGAGIRPAPCARPGTAAHSNASSMHAVVQRPQTGPAPRTTFTDARGNTYGASGDRTGPASNSTWGRTTVNERPVASSSRPATSASTSHQSITDARGNRFRPGTGETVPNKGGSWERATPAVTRSDNDGITRPSTATRSTYPSNQRQRTPDLTDRPPRSTLDNSTLRGNGSGGSRQQAIPGRSNSTPQNNGSIIRGGSGSRSGGTIRGGGGGSKIGGSSRGSGSRGGKR